MNNSDPYDLFVIGGGINGCGIARDAVGRGFSVMLAEKDDLASGTSSSSTKLIHGGLRYLEHYEFRLVREALMEREVLWRMAPHIIWPMRFILPHQKGLRPAWFLRLGLFLYDHLGGRKLLPPTRVLDLKADAAGTPLKPGFSKAFEYSDCWVNDARLVALNARDAADRGAEIRTRTKVVETRRDADAWSISLEDGLTGQAETVRARLLINAAGPWVDSVLRSAAGENDARNVRLVQGSHIVIKRKFEDARAFFFQNRDERIIFAIPYEGDFTLIGTTDRDFNEDLDAAEISDDEISYLCSAASEYFAEPVTRDDVVWTYSGVRPLYDDGASAAQEATRDYVLVEEGGADEGLLINIFGGKITTYRRLAEAVIEKVERRLGKRKAGWTANSSLPGGDFAANDFQRLLSGLKERFRFLTDTHAHRLMRLYGTRAEAILGSAGRYEDLGTCFGSDLYAAEVDYLVENEWAVTAEDILWRRTKRGLHMSEEQISELSAYLRTSKTEKLKAG
ncbi:glycerol-3-phosphate dehydrogenase [Hoeflea poritis]|uniref:Glycerol-3-phosphate dehydrogenase n=1 Tax=Hoeflea poritis TaxID=2993659 RepID=A0ABT4VR32_9HYPH|nr:glycerol-3-phosphate dehydrogenase [Hoeflea poritis]MDA4846547.1 glycerol-3-phosphate dehydrogenase [Hoeflea poritis]